MNGTKLKSEIMFARCSGGSNNDSISVTIMDDESNITVVEFDLTLEQFGKLVSCGQHVKTEVTYNNADLLGKKREHKSIAVEVEWDAYSKHRDNWYDYIQSLVNAAMPGWEAYNEERHNHHHVHATRGDINIYMVSIERWV